MLFHQLEEYTYEKENGEMQTVYTLPTRPGLVLDPKMTVKAYSPEEVRDALRLTNQEPQLPFPA